MHPRRKEGTEWNCLSETEDREGCLIQQEERGLLNLLRAERTWGRQRSRQLTEEEAAWKSKPPHTLLPGLSEAAWRRALQRARRPEQRDRAVASAVGTLRGPPCMQPPCGPPVGRGPRR